MVGQVVEPDAEVLADWLIENFDFGTLKRIRHEAEVRMGKISTAVELSNGSLPASKLEATLEMLLAKLDDALDDDPFDDDYELGDMHFEAEYN